ncbi:MAG TPA: hypothetical protein VG387_15420 [Rhizomicrobium sp.]|jgi:hypothetical protein|nr:hypothetical protein [Rhizomicrobium sp.]
MRNIWSRLGLAACVAVAAQAALTAPTTAADNVVMISIGDAMVTPDFHEKLDGSVKFYFGSQAHPAIDHKFGDLVTNEKTNALGKPAIVACNWVFLSGLLKFQERAHQLGANAVVNIDSYYDREDVPSETTIQCHKGFLLAGVALKGDFVKIH